MSKLKISHKAVRAELARRELWEYCRLTDPKNYDAEIRGFLVTLCNTLDDFLSDRLLKPDGTPYMKLMLNLPPRHLKTYTLINAITWWLGHNPEKQVISMSYNETLAHRFSRGIRDKIGTESASQDRLYFQDVFEHRLKKGDSGQQMWALEGSHHTYLGSSLLATVTGIGCHLGVIDDPIKNDIEAYNDLFLEDLFFHYNNTFLSRLEEGAKQIINSTRWSVNDPCGKLLEIEPEDWYVLKMPAVQDYDMEKMLCPDILSFPSFLDKTRKGKMSDEIVAANYQQEPVEVKGRLYRPFQTFTELPQGQVRSYTDTADLGEDYLCHINYVEHEKQAYVVDVIYSKAAMEITEPQVCMSLLSCGVDDALFESNNGGRGFARAVVKLMKEKDSGRCSCRWFHQGKNKPARILSWSNWVSHNVFFPVGWEERWPVFAEDVINYRREGRNLHDDGPDVLTGIGETINKEIGRTSGLGGGNTRKVYGRMNRVNGRA